MTSAASINRIHADDDLLCVWKRSGDKRSVSNFDGWTITRDDRRQWHITRPDGCPLRNAWQHCGHPSLVVAKLEAEIAIRAEGGNV